MDLTKILQDGLKYSKPQQQVLAIICVALLIFGGLLAFQILSLNFQVQEDTRQIAKLFAQVNNQQAKLEEQQTQLADQTSQINELESTVSEKQSLITSQQQRLAEQESQIAQQQQQINTLNSQVGGLQLELGKTTSNLQDTQSKLTLAANYQTRVEQGEYLSKAYQLLSDIDSTKQLIANDQITEIHQNPTDQQIWNNAKDIYDWIGQNFSYCGDKSIKIGGSSVQFQFWSPDELLADATKIKEANYPCGDCDDKAQLFAGMMYAAGVPSDKAFVVCGNVPGGYHCWNYVIVNNATYRVDPVCSSPPQVINYFWIFTSVQKQYLPDTPATLDCFSSYTADVYYNPNGYFTISKS